MDKGKKKSWIDRNIIDISPLTLTFRFLLLIVIGFVMLLLSLFSGVLESTGLSAFVVIREISFLLLAFFCTGLIFVWGSYYLAKLCQWILRRLRK